MANQPKITATFEFDWSIDRTIWNIWSESVSKDAIQSPLFGPDCVGSTKFQLKLAHSSVLKEYKLILVLVSIDDSEGGLEVKCKKINRNETDKDLVNHSYTRMEVGSRCEIWKSVFSSDLYESFFKNIHFEFKCKFPYKINSKSQAGTFEPKEAQPVGENVKILTPNDKSSDEPRHRQDSATVALQHMQTIDHLHKTLLESRKEFQELIADANTKIGDLILKNEHLNREIETLKKNNEESNTKIVETKTNDTNLKEKNELIIREIGNLKQDNVESSRKIVDLMQKNEQVNREISILKQDNANSNRKIDDSMRKNELINREIGILKQNNEVSNKKIVEAETRINNLTKSSVPIGFIYVQLSSQRDPQTLWPTMGWADVTSQYAGLFFRAEGGGASQFGIIQPENAPRITEVRHYKYALDVGNGHWDVTNLKAGEWSSGIGVLTGSYSGLFGYTHRFLMSGGEIRPRNSAIRIWKRTT